MLPFTIEQFIGVFARYNAVIWPAQILAYALAVGMLFALWRGSSRVVAAGLAAMWLWTGVGYHWLHFTAINQAAWLFGFLFILQGLWLAVLGVFSDRLRFAPGQGALTALGWVFIAYAMVVYPLLGVWTGHAYPGMPMFGVTPCPVTIFTFGLLLMARPAIPWSALVIPVVWSLVGGSAAFLLGIPQDWVLLVSGLAVVPIVLRDRRHGGLAFR